MVGTSGIFILNDTKYNHWVFSVVTQENCDTNIAFDPFAHGFNFAVGFNQLLPANIGTW